MALLAVIMSKSLPLLAGLLGELGLITGTDLVDELV
jgi:hypothetical protein